MIKNLIIDFDSTLLSVETLEELFELSLKDLNYSEEIVQKVKEITNKGMSGEIPFNESLSKRISLLPLTIETISRANRIFKTKLTSSFLQNLDELKRYDIYIISGGFRENIEPLIKEYGIHPSRIYANSFVFDKGKFIGIDTSSLLSNDRGKVQTVRALKLKPEETIVIGDGMSDYQIKEEGLASYFIYYGEHVKREKVIEKADRDVNSFDEVVQLLRAFL